MKKIILLITIAFYLPVLINNIFAQTNCPCPERFVITDSGCTRITAMRSGNGFSISDSIRACKGSKVTYTITALANGCTYPGMQYSYAVSAGNMVTSSGAQFTIQWGNTSPASVSINYFLNLGAGIQCAGSFTITALLTNNPVAAYSISPNPACFNSPAVINFNSNASMNAVNYFWDFGDGFQGTGPNPTHNYTSPGTYVITLIVTSPTAAGGGGTAPQLNCPQCADSIKHTLVINNLPGPPIECIAVVCPGEKATYCTPALACATYTWTVTGGSFTGQGTPCIQVLWGSGNPQGTISLVVSGCPNYCSQGTTVTVPIVPASTTISGPSPVCLGSISTYSLPAFPAATYNWTLSGGGTITGNNTNTPQININWTTPGTFTINCNYFDSSKGCGGLGSLQVTVLPAAHISGLVSFCAGNSVTLNSSDQFNTPVSATWTVSPAGTSFTSGNVGSSVTITSNNPGVYIVTATPGGSACNVPIYTITVLPKPILNPIQGSDSICPGHVYVYSVSSNASGAFSWTIANGSAVYLSANNDSAQITWTTSGIHTISITQTSIPAGCVSDPKVFTAFAYPTPAISGPISVCADDSVSYTVTNMGTHPFNWSVYPANYGTILSGQGTNTISIKWHGSINPGSNTVHLHISLCKDDSIAVTINKPVLPAITQTGSLCGGGVSLNPNATGSPVLWTGVEHVYSANTLIATGILLPGHYTVTIGNYNGTGCSVTATYFVQDIGRPTASISADNVVNYCLPNTPNMNLVAASAPGYTYMWYQSPSTPVGTNSPMLPINGLTMAGSYTYYCVVQLNGCMVTSNSITITISNCNPGTGPGCTGAINVSNITGCNPFTLTLVATAPSGGTIVSGTTIISYSNALPTNGNTTITFDSVGYKQITVCADIAIPGGGTTRCCKDTVVLVKVASKFLANNNCGTVTLTDLSTVVSPSTINSYNWTVGLFPGNTPVPPGVASFNNSTIASPVLTVTVSGQYIITQQITSGSCTVSSMDTISISVPNAAFTLNNSCVGTPISFNGGAYSSYLWDFGDAATSYTQNTSHAYATAGIFTVTHTVTDMNGCSNTVTMQDTIIAKPTCIISYSGPTTFCAGNNLVLNACAGYSNYQWYNNAAAMPSQTNPTFTATQTGNYSFTAQNANGCIVSSDTVSITVNPAPNVVITSSGSHCVGGTFNIGVQSCNTCNFVWTDNNIVIPGFTTNQGSIAITAGLVGTHTYSVTVTNNSTGCTATAGITTTFYNVPTVSISAAPNPAVLCSNNLYTLTATSNAVNPAWAWTYNAINIILSATNTLNASAAGTYTINVTDGITGCTASTSDIIEPSPDLSLFPSGCDTLCDTAHVFLPLGSINGNIANFNITWYKNAPPYTMVIATGPVLNLNTLPLGNNSISVIVINNITGCTDTSNNYNIYLRHCGKCGCSGSSWDSLHWHHASPPNDGRTINISQVAKFANQGNVVTPPADTAFVCGQNLGQFNCNNPISIFAKYKCNPGSCDSSVTYTLTGPISLSGIMPFNTYGLPPGNYVLIMKGKCLDSVCKICDVPFSIVCDTTHHNCTCAGSNWDSLYWHHATGGNGGTGGGDGGLLAGMSNIASQNNVVTPPADTAFTCGQNLGIINCNNPISIFAKFHCNPGSCDSSVKYVLTGPVSGNGIMPFSTAGLPAGNYVLILTGKCGDSVCKVCDVPFTIKCDTIVNCCQNSHWAEGPFWVNNGTHVTSLITCNSSSFLINTINKNCFISTIVKGTFVCGNGCASHPVYELYDSATNTLITSSNDSLLIAGSLNSGAYYVKIKAYCGTVLCQTCNFTFKKICSCDCDSTKTIVVQVTTNNVIKKYNCGAVIPPVYCTTNAVMSATFTCTPTACPPAIGYQLTGPYGITTGNLPLTISTLPQGTYSIIIMAYCNGRLCKYCNSTFSVKCDSVPPPSCCPYNIGITANNTSYSLTPTGNATVFNPSFAITGLTGVQLAEVKAEVQSYTISSNYNNECLGCKTLPFTWASITKADSIGIAPPQITLYNATASTFVPTGNALYQNPREVVWANANGFTITHPLGISFLLPPPPVIECCELSGHVCVKFTFKDIRCKVCEVIVCFDFSINNGNIFKFCAQKIAKAD